MGSGLRTGKNRDQLHSVFMGSGLRTGKNRDQLHSVFMGSWLRTGKKQGKTSLCVHGIGADNWEEEGTLNYVFMLWIIIEFVHCSKH